MKIRQLQLIGFKSFADKTAISLHDGITCIVGPNGCGKSNIVDAFRWVLGEQSARSLRGEKMEEVIFQGSSTKKIRGMAEVTLKVDRYRASQNGDSDNGNGGSTGAVPGEGELSVSRRLYRSGESEYLTNNRQCRLRDIRDIFLDTGLDVRSYSILDQGRISEILNAKAQDRRFLIEEVAGVMKYKVKKAEALSKLDSSKQNLQRINDIVTEVKRQIGSLDGQVKKAERYRRLTEEIKAIDLRTAKGNISPSSPPSRPFCLRSPVPVTPRLRRGVNSRPSKTPSRRGASPSSTGKDRSPASIRGSMTWRSASPNSKRPWPSRRRTGEPGRRDRADQGRL
ncbi:MAG: AAA family ATPase [Desulfosudis oleivorans]|nr:AAA family ATPase [Desulfosudis oleivorans]